MPIHRQLAHVRHRNGCPEHAFSRRGQRWLGHRGVIQKDYHVARQHAMDVYIVEQPAIARAEQDHAVRDAGPVPFKREMDNEQRRAEALAHEPARLILAAFGPAEQIAAGMRSEERRVGKEWVSTVEFRWWPET